MIEYWEPRGSFEKPDAVEWTTKSETGLYEFKKVRRRNTTQQFVADDYISFVRPEKVNTRLIIPLTNFDILRDPLPPFSNPNDIQLPHR